MEFRLRTLHVICLLHRNRFLTLILGAQLVFLIIRYIVLSYLFEGVAMSSLRETLTSYVPALISRRLVADSASISEPTSERFPAAVLLMDISGFEVVTERLMRQGPAGPEMLSQLLNRYFGALIDIIIAHGGDVVKFASDALLALWPATLEMSADEQAETLTKALAAVTLRAAQCGLAAQQALHNYLVDEDDALSLRVMIDAGDISVVYIGGELNRWEFLVVGLPLIHIGEAKSLTQPGDVMLCPQAWQLVQMRCTGLRLATGDVRLQSVNQPLPPRELAFPRPPFESESALWSYIPGAIRARLDAGQGGWLAELRTVTVLFINLPDLNLTAPLALAQGIMLDVQRALYRYEGSISKISVDDKGVTFVAALGLSPLAHKDDAIRGVRAALAIQARLRTWGLRNVIGIATGPSFCGDIGNEKRREYTLIGSPVNLAAHLMQTTNEERMVSTLCDAATYQAAQSEIVFSSLPPVLLKGRPESIFVYQPLEPKETRSQVRAEMVGRVSEREYLTDRLESLLHGESSMVFIEGEAGIGKSRLVESLLEQARAFGVTTLFGAGDAVEQTTSYYAWRSIFRQLFHLDPPAYAPDSSLHWAGAPIMGSQYSSIKVRLKRVHPSLVNLLPLLKSVLPLDLPDNYLTAQMTGEVRADNTREVLVRLLQDTASTSPLLVILEDAQWLDYTSWALARLVSKDVHPLFFVLVTSPLQNPLPDAYVYLRALPQTRVLDLGTFGVQEIRALIRQRLGMTRVPDAVVNFIHEKSEGHPLFSEELVYAMRDAGLLQFTDGECRLAPGTGDLQALDFVDTVQGAITGRIDRLTPPQQLTLKVASIIGRSFSYRVLYYIYPLEADKPHLREYLDALSHMGLIVLETSEPDVSYRFRHLITREVAYGLMSFAQRRQLHRAVAEWYELTYADDLSPFYPLLVYHWQRAEVPHKAIDYLEKSGEQALRSGAYQEALGFFHEVLDLDKAHPVPREKKETRLAAIDVRRARWERLLGDAYWGVGNTLESITHVQRALTLLGQSEPVTRWGWVARSVQHVVIQVAHRLGSWLLLPAARSNIKGVEVGGAYRRLAEAYYLNNQFLRSFHAGLRALNVLENAGAHSSELAQMYASFCAGSATLPLPGVSRIYKRCAQTVVDALDSQIAKASVLFRLSFYDVSAGRWKEAESALGKALQIAEHLGDWRLLGDGLTMLGLAAYYQGDFARVGKLGTDLYALAGRYDNIQHRAYSLNMQGLCAAQSGDLAQAVEKFQAAWDLLSYKADRVTRILNRGVLAITYTRQMKYRVAFEAAHEVEALLKHSWPFSAFSFEGYAAVAHVYLDLWATSVQNPDILQELEVSPAMLVRLTRRACRSLAFYAWLFPIGRPRAWLYYGMCAWLAGKSQRAHKAWQRSLVEAQTLSMAYAEALAHYTIGRHLQEGNTARQEHLAHAATIFETLGALYDLERVQENGET